MKMDDLSGYGYPQSLIEIWKREESEDLLPIQQRAIQEFGILDDMSHNLLIIAPTSSGKTFVGEMAAVKKALNMQPTLFMC